MKTLEYDILIIGSGAGGGTLASRLIPLAKKGLKIAVLEAGPYYPKEYLTQREIEMMGLFYNGGAWPNKDASITMSIGEAMGGSTLMYTGVTFRLPDEVIQDWGIEGITPEDMKPRFDRIEKEINVIEPTEEMTNDNNRLFKEGCEKMGFLVEKIPLNLRDCEQMAFCNLGCAKGHKQGTANVQIPAAQSAGIELIPNCRVSFVKENEVHATITDAPEGTIPSLIPIGEYTFKAKKIVISGGTAGTTALLLKSGFGKKLPTLGKYITLHPAMTINGIYPQNIKNYKGFPKVYYTTEFSHSDDFYIETAFYYPFITTKNLCLWGEDLMYVMKKYNQIMSAIILLHDEAKESNYISLDKKGNPVMNYKLSPTDIEKLCKAQIKSAEIFFSAGCEAVIMPASKPILLKKEMLKNKSLADFIKPKKFLPTTTPVASAHLQGGCKMGANAQNSVTDSYGKIHGYKDLYIADGSLFPKSSHVNPYLTIMALADRVAEKIISEMETDGAFSKLD